MPIGRSVLTGRPMLAAGQRDRYVTILQASEAAGGSGYPVETWPDLGADWMSRHDLRADERFEAGQFAAAAETQWQLAYRADMDPELVDVPKSRRLRYMGREFEILTATLIGNRDGIELLTVSSSRIP